jgi:hypothetical protein
MNSFNEEIKSDFDTFTPRFIEQWADWNMTMHTIVFVADTQAEILRKELRWQAIQAKREIGRKFTQYMKELGYA